MVIGKLAREVSAIEADLYMVKQRAARLARDHPIYGMRDTLEAIDHAHEQMMRLKRKIGVEGPAKETTA